MANYYTITANFFGSQPIIEHLTTLMENFDRLPDLSNINADEDWLPLIFDNKTLEQFDDDDYSLGVSVKAIAPRMTGLSRCLPGLQ